MPVKISDENRHTKRKKFSNISVTGIKARANIDLFEEPVILYEMKETFLSIIFDKVCYRKNMKHYR
jgi:hypothetical protein